MKNRKVIQDGRAKKRPGLEGQKRIIVDAAVDLFSIKGSSQVSIAEICTKADVGRQTFYRCFSGKDDLIRYLYQYAVNEHIEAGLNSLQNVKLDDNLMPAIVDRVIDIILERHKLAQFIYVDSSDTSSAAHKIIDESIDMAAGVIQNWYINNTGAKPGKVYLKAVLSATTWLVNNAIRSGLSNEAIAETKRCTEQLFRGVFLTTRKADERKIRAKGLDKGKGVKKKKVQKG